VRCIIDDNFKLDAYVKLLIETLKKIICIEKITVLSIEPEKYHVNTNIDTPNSDTSSPAVQAELRKLSESLEIEKATDITKQANKYPNLAPLLKSFKNNFCIKVRQEHLGEVSTLVYVFHFDFQSIRILLEK